MKTSGKVFKYGDSTDMDVIIPAGYLNTSDPKELTMHHMEDVDSDFTKEAEKGSIAVANKSFGCGSSREHAPIAIEEGGVSCVVASTFARTSYRNAISTGLPIIECGETVKSIDAGDELEIDLTTGVINNKSKKQEYEGRPFPESMQKIINSDGLVNYVKSEKAKNGGGKS